MAHEFPQPFARNYERLHKRLRLRGMQPKTIEAYSHGVRRAAAHFDYRIDDLSKDQLTDYFAQILDQLSWSNNSELHLLWQTDADRAHTGEM